MREFEAAAWIDATLDAGQRALEPDRLDGMQRDPALLDDTIERANITLPRRVLRRLDAIAKSAGARRSGTIARLTLHASAA